MRSSSLSIWSNPLYFLAFGFGAGSFPWMPGTMGTLVAIPIYLLMNDLPLSVYGILVLIFFIFGIWCCQVTEKALGIPDYPGIVWDEIVGYLVTMFNAPHGLLWVILGFVLFRIFDIFKPWPIDWLNKHLHGGLGIMADDVMAAVYSWIIIQMISAVLAFYA